MNIINEEQIKNNLSRNIRYLRHCGKPLMSQTTLAKKLGTTQRSLSNYEQALCLPPLQILAAMAVYFGLSVDELLYDTLDREERKV